MKGDKQLNNEIESIATLEQLHDFMENNLLTKAEAAKITGQSLSGFNQSVKLGYIKPFYESSGATSSKVRLYLKDDLIRYRENKQSH